MEFDCIYPSVSGFFLSAFARFMRVLLCFGSHSFWFQDGIECDECTLMCHPPVDSYSGWFGFGVNHEGSCSERSADVFAWLCMCLSLARCLDVAYLVCSMGAGLTFWETQESTQSGRTVLPPCHPCHPASVWGLGHRRPQDSGACLPLVSPSLSEPDFNMCFPDD